MSTTTLAGTVATQANVYFDGKCVSHTVTLADGVRKSVGVILPATLTFNTGAPEIMETVAGKATIKLAGASEWQTYGAGMPFVPVMDLVYNATNRALVAATYGRGIWTIAPRFSR